MNMGRQHNLVVGLNLLTLLVSDNIKSNQTPSKSVLSPTYYYPAVLADHWDIVFISQMQNSTANVLSEGVY